MTTPEQPPRFNPQQYGYGQQGGPPQQAPRPAQQPQWQSGAHQVPGQQGPGAQGAPVRRKGLVGALLDTKFDAMVTPMLVRAFYMLALTVISLQCAFFLILGLVVVEKDWGWVWGLLMIGVSPLVWLVEALGTRMALEFVINQFKITEELQKIRRSTGGA
ncbi:DUF4282 domain-containing protein [Actinocorallia longicatena]|uniref:DUF4282 domain-containing protein n=1 Tax=Actinocorallia longicatena TaxID=111803 RepID=A0ABP6Q447_9ACTN